MDGNTWLIVLTDRRIIFLDKGLIYGLKQSVIDLAKVNTVSGQTGILFGAISIQDGASNRTIKNVPKGTVIKFTNKLEEALQALRDGKKSATTSTDDVYAKLEKLASLRERGILTPDEFDQEKAKLLAD